MTWCGGCVSEKPIERKFGRQSVTVHEKLISLHAQVQEREDRKQLSDNQLLSIEEELSDEQYLDEVTERREAHKEITKQKLQNIYEAVNFDSDYKPPSYSKKPNYREFLDHSLSNFFIFSGMTVRPFFVGHPYFDSTLC